MQLAVGFSVFFVISCSSAVVAPVKQTAAHQPASSSSMTTPPQVNIEPLKPTDIINVQSLIPTIQVQMAYAGHSNFTGKVVPGYQANSCYLHKKAAVALSKVALQAELLGYQLQMLDCYRPHRASLHFMQWVDDNNDQITKANYYPNLEKNQLKEGYIAAFSGHSRASTVDLTLLRKDTAGIWQPVDMGGRYDLFDPVSHLSNSAISPQQMANRLLLKDLMQQQGFSAYAMEWWHFRLEHEHYVETYFDFEVR